MKKIKIAVLPGDGIGQEVMAAALPVFTSLKLDCIELIHGDIGWECWRQLGDSVPQATWDLIKNTDGCLLGAVTSKPLAEAEAALPESLKGKNRPFVSPVIQLRQQLHLFANVRPIMDLSGAKEFNFVVIRENTEGLYAGLDYSPIPTELKTVISQNPSWAEDQLSDASCTIRLQTQQGLLRLFKYAFEFAQNNGFERVTFADKPNVMRKSGSFAKGLLEQVAVGYPQIDYEILNVDAVGLWMVKKPERFGVIVAENMFGDILSDVGAGIMGGLGFAPSANLGERYSYFEPVHGSAPTHAGKNKANPSAMFLSIALMLKHFGLEQQAQQIQTAISKVVQQGKVTTYDLGGHASTTAMAQEILRLIENNLTTKKFISLIATGDELVKGEVLDTNSQYFAQQCFAQGIQPCSQQLVIDDQNKIEAAIKAQLKVSDALIVCGGLGPTSDDKTRFALANVLASPLEFNPMVWEHITRRLENFGLTVHESNKQQALFPTGATLITNPNGTAYGFKIKKSEKIIYVLPGPPRECRPMFDNFVMADLRQNKFFSETNNQLFYKLLGVIESEVAYDIDSIAKKYQAQTGYRWNYPYLDVKVFLDSENGMNEISSHIENHYKKNVVAKENITALKKLQKKLNTSLTKKMVIYDNLSRGQLQKQLSAMNSSKIEFISEQHEFKNNENLLIIFEGLTAYYQDQPFTGTTEMICKIYGNDQLIFSDEQHIPYRGKEVIDYSVEYMACQLLKCITPWDIEHA